ncbi:MAG: thioredoxin family protein [Candidatus Brockarchaeota archaeon]|nr:thioredoxin family protein [Candidatus Brockarchaeota archaeon]
MSERDRESLKNNLAQRLRGDVRLIVFTQENECEFCAETRQMAQLLSSLSEKIKLEVYDFAKDSGKAKELGVDKIPAIVPIGSKDYGVRFFGIPAGYEFASLVEAVVDVSTGTTNLDEKTKQAARALSRPIHIQVFVTPTCPYCQKAVRTAHQLAVESDFIRADMVESVEFPQMVQRYAVMAVPKVVINEKTEFVGAIPEGIFVQHVMLAARNSTA